MNKEQLSEDFAVKILNLERDLSTRQHERIVSYQIGKSGTSIGTNIAESVFAESDDDFIHKLSIAQKECNETLFWLRILRRTSYIEQLKFNELYSDCESLLKIISSIIVKMKKKRVF